MRNPWQWLWATVAFAAELASLAALAVAGWSLPAPTPVRLLAAIGFLLVAAVLWGLFAAPRAVVAVPALALVTKVLVHGAAVVALLVLGHPVLPSSWPWRPCWARRCPGRSARRWRADPLQESPDELRARAVGEVHLPAGGDPGVDAHRPGQADEVVEDVLPDPQPAPRGRRHDRPRCPHQVLLEHLAARGGQHLPVELRPQRQRPAAHLEVEVAEAAVLDLVRRPEDGGPQGQAARRAPRVLQRLPAGVRRVRLAFRGAQPGQRLEHEIGAQIGHPAQQHEAELAAGQPLHGT